MLNSYIVSIVTTHDDDMSPVNDVFPVGADSSTVETGFSSIGSAAAL